MKTKNKLYLLSLKYLPIAIAMGIFGGINMYLFEIHQPFTSCIAGGSIFINLHLYLGSKVFRFCSWHRTLIWYNISYYCYLMMAYYIKCFPDVYDFIDIMNIISIIVFIIAYLNRNKK